MKLADIVAPLSVEEFLADYWEKQVLYVERADPGWGAPLLRFEDVDALFTSHHCWNSAGYNLIASQGTGRDTRTVSYARDDRGADPLEALYDCYDRGDTIRFGDAQLSWPSFGRLAVELERELCAKVIVSVYLTPAGTQALPLHQDLHDVLVLQLGGSKEWEVWAPSGELPVHRGPEADVRNGVWAGHRRGDRSAAFYPDRPQVDPDAPQRRLTMRPGDVLYLPRGTAHRVRANERSLHATIGFHPVRWFDVLTEAIAMASYDDVRLRGGLPPGFLRRPETRASMKDSLRTMLRRIADDPDLDAALDCAEELLLARTTPFPPDGHLARLGEVEQMTVDTRLALRGSGLCKVTTDSQRAYILFAGRGVAAPLAVADALRFVARAHGAFRIGDLPGALADTARLQLARRLVREGLLTIVDPTGGER